MRKRLLPAGLGLILFLSLHPSSAFANPGFARKYNVSCVMCHAGFPKLNSFGELFAANGYQFPGGNPTASSDSFGDPKLKLEKGLNLAVRVDSFFRYRSDTSVHSDIESPFLLKLFIVGYLAKDVTFYSYFLANEGGEVVGIEDAFVYFNNIGGKDLDVQIGQFQVMDPVFSREQRLTFQDIEIYVTRVGASPFELTYQRGGLVSYNMGRAFVVGGVVNGNGIGRRDPDGNFDHNTPKDFLLRVATAAGPVDIGLFGYKGRTGPISGGAEDSFIRYGPDLRMRNWIKNLDLRAQWLFGRDDNPGFSEPAVPVRLNGGFVEVDYHFNPDWTGIFLYNRVDSQGDPAIEKSLATTNLTHYFLRNLKGFVEYTHDLQETSAGHPEKAHTALLGAVLAF